MKKIEEVNVKYEAYDGTVFNSEKECVKHESKKWFSEDNRIHLFMEDWWGDTTAYLVRFDNVNEFYDFDLCVKGVRCNYGELYYEEPTKYPYYGVYVENDCMCDVYDFNRVIKTETDAIAKMMEFLQKGELK